MATRFKQVCTQNTAHFLPTQGEVRYDVILDNLANHSLAALRRVLTPDGIVLPNSGHGGLGPIIAAGLQSMFLRRQGGPILANPNRDDLNTLKDLIESDRLKPVIDRTYSLDTIIEAFEYISQGHARGKVVIEVLPKSDG